jgi:hypothetical protein
LNDLGGGISLQKWFTLGGAGGRQGFRAKCGWFSIVAMARFILAEDFSNPRKKKTTAAGWRFSNRENLSEAEGFQSFLIPSLFTGEL